MSEAVTHILNIGYGRIEFRLVVSPHDFLFSPQLISAFKPWTPGMLYCAQKFKNMRSFALKSLAVLAFNLLITCAMAQTITYPIVGTGVSTFYNASGVIAQPASGAAFYGQDAQYPKNTPSYTNNGDGTISDNVTGLMWQKNMGSKITFPQAITKADTLTLGGYTDWRLPTIKELYSLIQFTGKEGLQDDSTGYIKYIDVTYFDQPFGNLDIGERLIDAQTWSANQYTGFTMAGDSTVFGVNFIDGRIKGYPKYQPPTFTSLMVAYYRMVRGNPQYGVNDFVDNGDGTISDLATGLMWQKADDSTTRDWEDALSYAENLVLAGYDDWRLPDSKELQSIVDYSRCPQATSSPAIDPLFQCTEITDPNGVGGQYGYYWSSTTHLTGPTAGDHAAYVAFGKAQGKMNNTLMDVHGAGSQRSDPKTGDPADYPAYFGPQGDVQYVFNFVRCVRTIPSSGIDEMKGESIPMRLYPNPASTSVNVVLEGTTGKTVQLNVFNVYGAKVMESSADAAQGQVVIDVSKLQPGLYSISASWEQGTSAAKFIKK
jgi:hypothetical protein